MATVFIIHGSFGNPNENWYPWLKKELEKKGHTVFVPPFPTPDGQSLEDWRAVFLPYELEITEETVVIGHSIGVAFLLRFLEQSDVKIHAAFFVSGFASLLHNEFDAVNTTFLDHPFLWNHIREHCGKFVVFHGENDPYVPVSYAKELAASLGTTPLIIPDAGHFNEKSRYKDFPLLLEKILEVLKI